MPEVTITTGLVLVVTGAFLLGNVTGAAGMFHYIRKKFREYNSMAARNG